MNFPVTRQLTFKQIREQIKGAIASGGYEAWAEYRDLLVSLCPIDDFDNPYAGCSDPKSRDEANGIYR